MKVIQINEDWHGFIGIAKDYKSALDFLLNYNWLEDSTEVCVNHEWKRIDEVLGEDWFDKMQSWDVENFNEYWEDSFMLTEVEVYGA